MSKKEQYSQAVTAALTERGLSFELASAIGSQLNTKYTSERMLGYLRSISFCNPEIIIDEMLIIIEDRDRFMKKQIEKRKNNGIGDNFIRFLSVDWNNPDAKESYAAEIPALASLRNLSFNKKITFFCGENGSGKSTLLEAMALALGLNPEGGTQNYSFSTYDDYSPLYKALKITRGSSRPEKSYFLRAESFYNVSTAALKEYNPDSCMPDYHARSHGESFLDFIVYHSSNGLFLMDEPEAALSPQRQLGLLAFIVEQSRNGSQFIIATHSPILLGTPEAEIYSFDNTIHSSEYTETESYRIMSLFINNREAILRRLLSD